MKKSAFVHVTPPPTEALSAFATVTCQPAGQSADSEAAAFLCISGADSSAAAASLQDRMYPDQTVTLCVCVCVHVRACVCMCTSRDSSVLSNFAGYNNLGCSDFQEKGQESVQTSPCADPRALVL